jgi:cell division protein FtsW
MTATLCLLAFGAVMVYCATSPGSALSAGGSGAGTFVHYVLFGSIGVAAMYALERRGLQLFNERVTALLLLGSFVLLLAVKMPGIGVELGGARRWIALGPFQFQPSELMKLALVLHVARYLANNPRRMSAGFWDAIKPIALGPFQFQPSELMKLALVLHVARYLANNPRRMSAGFWDAIKPIALVVLPACALIAIEPDLGTALVVASSVLVLLLAAGLPGRHLLIIIACAAVLLLVIVMQSHYQRARLTSFLHPASAASIQGPEYQGYQGQVVLGSGGLFGVGLGKSVQNILSLPEAQTDFMLAVVGEQLGVAGIFGLVFLYGMIAYAGMRTARRAGTRYAKLLATGLTSLILCQGLLNIFVVLGLAPLTGVPLPFISYAPTNLCVMLASVGLLLNVSRPAARRLKAVDPIDGVTVSRRADGEREQRRGQRDERRGARPRRSTG